MTWIIHTYAPHSNLSVKTVISDAMLGRGQVKTVRVSDGLPRLYENSKGWGWGILKCMLFWSWVFLDFYNESPALRFHAITNPELTVSWEAASEMVQRKHFSTRCLRWLWGHWDYVCMVQWCSAWPACKALGSVSGTRGGVVGYKLTGKSLKSNQRSLQATLWHLWSLIPQCRDSTARLFSLSNSWNSDFYLYVN